MKKQSQELIYHNPKTKQSALVRRKFQYEVCVNLFHEKYYSQIKKEYYESLKPIEKFVESIFVRKNVQVTCELFAAPIEWLEDNDFQIWVKPEKKKRCKNVSEK